MTRADALGEVLAGHPRRQIRHPSTEVDLRLQSAGSVEANTSTTLKVNSENEHLKRIESRHFEKVKHEFNKVFTLVNMHKFNLTKSEHMIPQKLPQKSGVASKAYDYGPVSHASLLPHHLRSVTRPRFVLAQGSSKANLRKPLPESFLRLLSEMLAQKLLISPY